MSAPFEVAIDGRRYLAHLAQYGWATIDSVRQQGDQSREFGEATLSPNDLWPRSRRDWSLGAGQEWVDKEETSNPRRFHESVGIDPWREGELRLLSDTELARAGSASEVLRVGDKVVLVEGDKLVFSEDLETWDETDAFPGDIISATTDGTRVFAAVADDGVHFVRPEPGKTPELANVLEADLVAYVKGRLMYAAGPDLYNQTDLSDTTTPEPLTSSVIVPDWKWTCFGEAGQHIYAGGHAGDRSAVYRITIREDGTALGAPTQAAPLPSGERVLSLLGYVGYVVLGTSEGVRLAMADGALEYQRLLDVGEVRHLHAQDRFCWFGMASHPGDGAGLGRMDLSAFAQEGALLPAWASDLEADASGADIDGIISWDGRRAFLADGDLWVESGDLRPEGWLDVGRATWDLPHDKAWYDLTVRHDELPADCYVEAEVAAGGSTQQLTYDTGVGERKGLDLPASEHARVTLRLHGDGTNTPVVTRWTMRAHPQPPKGREIQVLLDLREQARDANGATRHQDPHEELSYLRARLGQAVDYVEWGEEYRAILDGLQYGPELSAGRRGGHPQGTAMAQLRTFDG